MKKSKLSPDAVRDAPEGEYQCPGQHSVLPARSFGDVRFNQYPMTYRVLGICASHASSYTGTFFVNQKTLADICQCSQQAISHHMTKLIKWGYLEKVRNQDVRRAYGKKGAVWRVIYDPRRGMEDVIAKATHKDPIIEQDAAKDTLAFIEEVSDKPVDNFIDNKVGLVQGGDCNGNNNKVQVVQENKPHLVNNYHRLTSKDNISEIDCKKLCNLYNQMVQRKYGKAWAYDFRQLDLAKDLLIYMDIDTFEGVADKLLTRMRDNNKPAPQSLLYFVKMQENKGKPMSVEALIKMTASQMKMPR